MRVRVSGKLSSSTPVLSGVPQGSCFGPVLFIIYINDLSQFISCNFKMFADDIKLYFSHRVEDLAQSVPVLQRNIDRLVSD